MNGVLREGFCFHYLRGDPGAFASPYKKSNTVYLKHKKTKYIYPTGVIPMNNMKTDVHVIYLQSSLNNNLTIIIKS